jgi:hypothetical protein
MRIRDGPARSPPGLGAQKARGGRPACGRKGLCRKPQGRIARPGTFRLTRGRPAAAGRMAAGRFQPGGTFLSFGAEGGRPFSPATGHAARAEGPAARAPAPRRRALKDARSAVRRQACHAAGSGEARVRAAKSQASQRAGLQEGGRHAPRPDGAPARLEGFAGSGFGARGPRPRLKSPRSGRIAREPRPARPSALRFLDRGAFKCKSVPAALRSPVTRRRPAASPGLRRRSGRGLRPGLSLRPRLQPTPGRRPVSRGPPRMRKAPRAGPLLRFLSAPAPHSRKGSGP